MDIIANSRQYVTFSELKKGDIFFMLFCDDALYMKSSDNLAVRLTDGESRKIVKSKLCELIDCVLVEKEIYTKLTEK